MSAKIKTRNSLSLTAARKIILTAQGLWGPAPFGSGKAGVVRAIEKLGYVQIDTISVVERAHHHVIWTRVPDYTPQHLHDLQTQDRKIFEYWSHAASYLPLSDYRFYLPRMHAFASGKRHGFVRNRRMMTFVLDRIRAEGALQARDFETPKGARSGPWFDWKPTKIALEQLFMEGKVMVRERRGFQKVYDLTERVLPPGVDCSMPSPQEMGRFLVERSLRQYGLATEAEMHYLRKGHSSQVRNALGEMCESSEVLSLQVEGLGAQEFFAFSESLKSLTQAQPGLKTDAKTGENSVFILSPFDNAVIQRKRLKTLFDFDYQIECYVPAPKRQYGYFCLPILWGDQMVGRMDAKADRKSKKLLVLALYLEKLIQKKLSKRIHKQFKDQFQPSFKKTLQSFAKFNGCEKVEMRGKGVVKL